MLNLNKYLKKILLTVIFGLMIIDVQATVITRGASGSDVKKVQEYLINQGYLLDDADGILGNNTAYAVKAFQKDMGLTINGDVDEKTMQTLQENNKKFENKEKDEGLTNKIPNIHLKKGDYTTQVHSVQVMLVKFGYLNDNADGIYGSNTAEAVKVFQKDNNLKVTGEVDGLTYRALEKFYKNNKSAKKDLNSLGKSNHENKALTKVNEFSAKDFGKNKKEFVLGDRAESLIELQEKLSVNGYSTNGTEGIFGAGTEKAVKAFQKDNGIKITGKIDAKTYEKIVQLAVKPKKYRKKFQVEATAYTSGVGGCGEYTSSGHKLRRGYIAVDPNVIPLGTEVFIDGYGFAIAADIGGSIKGKMIDVAVNSLEEAIQYGRQNTTLYIL